MDLDFDTAQPQRESARYMAAAQRQSGACVLLAPASQPFAVKYTAGSSQQLISQPTAWWYTLAENTRLHIELGQGYLLNGSDTVYVQRMDGTSVCVEADEWTPINQGDKVHACDDT